eukprot:m.864407 g.864407  ORF g.864407 m.864407 type:complete len:703 (-) comp23547_c0_seq10:3243-5351(-)
MTCFLLSVVGVLFAAVTAEDPWERAVHYVAQMTVEEKVSLVQGAGRDSKVKYGKYVGRTPNIQRLGIPELLMNDGPQGFRGDPGTSTMWPSGLTVAHSFDPELFLEWGVAMGTEFSGKGANVQFGPAVNVQRIANGGRSFEYLSGEDPFLGYTLVQPIVKGIQSQGVIANAKHYLDNNQEGYFGAGDRHFTSAVIDERTQMEIYFPPYEGAVEAGVLSFMCANNLINGVYACENNNTMNGLLKSYTGFKGWVCSDYDGTRSTKIASEGGLDIAMPGPPTRPDFFGAPLLASIKNGTIPESVVTDKATRIVYSMAVIGALDTPNTNTSDTDVTSPAFQQLALKLATASATLLQNDGNILPLNAKKIRSIALIGEYASGGLFGGGGSGSVVPKNTSAISINDALATYISAHNPQITLTYSDGKDKEHAVATAKAADVAIAVIGQTSHEGADRTSIALDYTDVAVAVAAAQPQSIVVSISPGPFVVPFRDNAAAIVDFGFSGEQQGNAVIDVLFGVANPAGKMPHTTPNSWNETKYGYRQYPGIPTTAKDACTTSPQYDPCEPTKAYYDEELLVGYRWYDAHDVEPAFPFGHGLSYTTFRFTGLKVAKTGVSFTLTNDGHVDGAEVPQLYLGFPSSAGEPPKQLKGFKKTVLASQESATVNIPLRERDFSIWDTAKHAWTVVSGVFQVYVGASSRDIRLNGTITM